MLPIYRAAHLGRLDFRASRDPSGGVEEKKFPARGPPARQPVHMLPHLPEELRAHGAADDRIAVAVVRLCQSLSLPGPDNPGGTRDCLGIRVQSFSRRRRAQICPLIVLVAAPRYPRRASTRSGRSAGPALEAAARRPQAGGPARHRIASGRSRSRSRSRRGRRQAVIGCARRPSACVGRADPSYTLSGRSEPSCGGKRSRTRNASLLLSLSPSRSLSLSLSLSLYLSLYLSLSLSLSRSLQTQRRAVREGVPARGESQRR